MAKCRRIRSSLGARAELQWSPYSDGTWTWEDGYGWTWVANEPWGWAPYHYGNWFYANGYGWAWYPPAYSALSGMVAGARRVLWIRRRRSGMGRFVGFGYPYIGWYPIAPYISFYPWWPGWAWTGVGWGWGGWGCCGCGWGGNVYNVTYVRNIYGTSRTAACTAWRSGTYRVERSRTYVHGRSRQLTATWA